MGSSSKNGAAGKGATTIRLPADCRMTELPALREQCLATPSSTLDATAVERVDTAALQLLVAFHRDALTRGGKITWTGVSTPLREAAERLGLIQALALPAAMPA
jgi:phospholipid transport system transporter-binding protein